MTDTALDIAPFDLLTRDEQYQHLSRMHKKSYQINTRTPKAEMEREHKALHRSETGVREQHTHTAIGGDRPTEPLDLTKRLNSSGRKALKDLVDNDFLALTAEINQMANDVLIQRRNDLRADWAAKGADKESFIRQAQELQRKYVGECQALVTEAHKAGVVLKTVKIDTYNVPEATVDGLNLAIRNAEAEVEADRKRALNTLERARLTAQRKVLMSGVDAEALTILDTIPTAKELMLAAAVDRPGLELDQ